MAYLERRVALDHERDKDLIDYLDSMSSHKANQLIRQLLREFIRDDTRTQLDRIESKINNIKSTIASGIAFSASPSSSHQSDNGGEDKELLQRMMDNLNKIGV